MGLPGTASPVVSLDADGSDQRTVADGTYVGVSRDGARVWFTRPSGQLWRMNRDGSGQQEVLSLPGELLTPAESPDGRLVAFTYVSTQTHMGEIWAAGADGSNPHRLAAASRPARSRQGQSFQEAVHPSWSVDGGTIAYSSTDSGRVEVWTVHTDGTGARQLIDGSGAGYPDSNVPEYSRDGSRIVYWSGYEAEYGEVWVMAADGSGRRRITDTPDPANADNPSWSPDGRLVVFISNRSQGPAAPGSDMSAWVVSVSGGEPRLLLHGARYCAWSPLTRAR